MKRSKLTKKALLCSSLVLLMSVTMLIGTTFAWFTDTASTSVNKIQAGTLDVVLEMKNPDYNQDDVDSKEWIDAEGETLSFVQASKGQDGNTVYSYVDATTILWEPGCTYELQPIRITNNGNLALKYKISISGIKGDAKLNEAIEWTISDSSLDSYHSLAVGASSDVLTIKGHMKEDAGNEYQKLSIDGIAITVYATQDTVEYDSYDNQYDKDAPTLKVSSNKLTNSFKDGEKVIFDNPVELNGKEDETTGEINRDSEAKLSNSGNVTLELKETVSNGEISSYTWGLMRVMPGTTLTIEANENGKFINTSGNSSNINVCGGKVIVNGGYFESTTSCFFVYTDDDNAISNISLTINGGTFKSTKNVINNALNLGIKQILINGGTFYNWNPSKYVNSDHVVNSSTSGTDTIYTVTVKS